MQLRIGDHRAAAPVVLAPMAGVTNAPFRTMCRKFGPGLVYVNEMVMATAVVHGNAKTRKMMTFAPDEQPRSLQFYGSDPEMMYRAVDIVCGDGLVDHVDLNFGCPAAKVTRKGGGAAVPAKPKLLAAVIGAAVRAATPYGVPVTAKFRMGLFDDLLTHLGAGEICEDLGLAWMALHARTAEQHYSGDARWDAIGELKQHVSIPVLGNGDIWTADDAVAMVAATDCDGVVIGRGCLGRPWLFGDLVAAFNGNTPAPQRNVGEMIDTMREHARLLCDHLGEPNAMRDFRKHASWYLTGYPVGVDVRRRAAMVSSLAELDDVVGDCDREAVLVDGGDRIRRGHTNGPIRVALPAGFLDDRGALESDMTVPDDGAVLTLSGG